MKQTHNFVFDKSNYLFLIIGLILNIVGFILMIGGAAESKEIFDEKELFSNIRITIAPMLIILGYVVIIFGIIKKNDTDQKSNRIVERELTKNRIDQKSNRTVER